MVHGLCTGKVQCSVSNQMFIGLCDCQVTFKHLLYAVKAYQNESKCRFTLNILAQIHKMLVMYVVTT